MMSFRVALCCIGLLLYLLVREFSAQETARPVALDALRPIPAIGVDLAPSPWPPAAIGVFQTVADRPANLVQPLP